MNDYLIKCLSYQNFVRIYATTSTNALNTIASRMNYYPSALAAVGRVLSVGVMMGGMLKNDESITIKVDGNGPIGLIMVDANASGDVRAYASNPHCHFEYDNHLLNVHATVGDKGFINVIKDLKLKEPFIGSVPIISGEIGEDFAYYFSASEQIPSAVSLGVLVGENNLALSSGGFIVQLMPNTPEEVVDLLEKKVFEIPSISTLLNEGKTPEDIAHLIGDETTIIIEKTPVQFKCSCSKERFERGILSLGYPEIKAMIDEDKKAHTVCHFCGNEYDFSEEDLLKILKQAEKNSV